MLEQDPYANRRLFGTVNGDMMASFGNLK